MKERTAIIFCIGRELLEGAVLDRNATFMAKNVSEMGHRVRSISVIDDVEEEAISAFTQALEAQPDYILVTGGMGPGIDDITRQCVSSAAGVPLAIDPTAEEMLARSYRRLLAKGLVEDAELNERRLVMAKIPKGATCFENPIGTAPALRLKSGASRFYLLPGMPEEMRRLFVQFVAPDLVADGPGDQKQTRVVSCPGGDESAISRMLDGLGRRYPGIKSRARLQGSGDEINLRITLTGKPSEVEHLEDSLDRAAADLRARLGLEMAPDSTGSENVAE